MSINIKIRETRNGSAVFLLKFTLFVAEKN